jgi:hypothetical protein
VIPRSGRPTCSVVLKPSLQKPSDSEWGRGGVRLSRPLSYLLARSESSGVGVTGSTIFKIDTTQPIALATVADVDSKLAKDYKYCP